MGPSPRGGAYTYDWIENLLGLDMHSADRFLPEFQHPQSATRLATAGIGCGSSGWNRSMCSPGARRVATGSGRSSSQSTLARPALSAATASGGSRCGDDKHALSASFCIWRASYLLDQAKGNTPHASLVVSRTTDRASLDFLDVLRHRSFVEGLPDAQVKI
jgi:hypothetical protein